MAELPTASVVAKLAARVAWRRDRRGLTQEALAAQLKTYRIRVTHIEQGDYQSLRLDLRVQLARALEPSSDFLLGLTDDPGAVRPPKDRIQLRLPASRGCGAASSRARRRCGWIVMRRRAPAALAISVSRYGVIP